MSKIGNLTPNIRINQQASTKVRQTVDQSFGNKLRTGLGTAASTVGNIAGAAIAAVPGGTILSAALSGAKNIGSSAAALTANSGGGAVAAAPTGAAGSATGHLGGNGPGALAKTAAKDSGIDAAQALFAKQSAFQLQYLTLQSNMSQESRKFTTISNIMKNRNDTAKNAIRNVN